MIVLQMWLDLCEFWLSVLHSPPATIILPPSPPPLPRPPSRVIDLAKWRSDHRPVRAA